MAKRQTPASPPRARKRRAISVSSAESSSSEKSTSSQESAGLLSRSSSSAKSAVSGTSKASKAPKASIFSLEGSASDSSSPSKASKSPSASNSSKRSSQSAASRSAVTSSSSKESPQAAISKSASKSTTSKSPPQSATSKPASDSNASDKTVEDNIKKLPVGWKASAPTPTISNQTATKATPVPKHVHVNKQSGLLSPSIREPSHDGTVILPSLPKTLAQLTSGALVPYQPADAFPIFTKGDVIIKAELGASSKLFQLHSAVLSRHSPWFANDFQASASDTASSWYSYTIEEVNGKVGLVRQRAENERPAFCLTQPQIIDDVVVKTEDMTEEAPTVSPAFPAMTFAARKDTANLTIAVKYYGQIFGTFYSIPPAISSTNITTALTQSEHLTKFAISLSSLHLLRPHIGNIFSHHRRSLFLAIKADPARWLHVAIPLRNQSIYTESLIHLIGAYPRWPATWATKRTVLTEDIRNLIKRKSEEIDRERIELERGLLLTTIPYGRKGLPLDPMERGQTETWITVQVFRDQLAQRIDQLDQTTDTLSRGTFFRGLGNGTLPCLETERVRKICEGTMRSDWKDLGDDLALLRGHAGKLAEGLARNELMIEPDVKGVGYLTCARIKSEDVPWLGTSGNSS